ncbi:MAG: SprT-like domain-containing protein [Flavobacteriaceae bacterium]
MQDRLLEYIPQGSSDYVLDLIKRESFILKIVSERKTKHGDFRVLKSGECQITVNDNLHSYQFLLTLIHEIAHYMAYKNYGHQIKAHGIEWKLSFQKLMLPLLNPQVFPKELLPYLANYLRNPKASTDSDFKLAEVLLSYGDQKEVLRVNMLQENAKFEYNSHIFQKLHKRRTRILCKRLKDGKSFLFSPNTPINQVPNS